MKLRTLGIFSLLFVTLAALSTGCRPYRHGEVGLEIDIHSANYHRDHHDDDSDYHDNGRHRGHRDRNGHWEWERD